MFWPLAMLLFIYGYIAGVAFVVWRAWRGAEDVLIPLEEAIRQILERKWR